MSVAVRVQAALYDTLLGRLERAGLAERRRRLLAAARGDVLEIGAGTGSNIPHYPEAVEALVLVEPEEPMARRAERRLAGSGRRGRVVQASAESLPFADGSFDTVVCTLVLCSVADPPAALGELRRVLRPAGRLLFLEHVRADEAKLARWQDRLWRPWRRLACGCYCNRRTVAAIEDAGFRLEELERGELPKAPPIVRPLAVGRAVLR